MTLFIFFFHGPRQTSEYKGCYIHLVTEGNETTVTWQDSDYVQHNAKTLLGAKRAITRHIKNNASN